MHTLIDKGKALKKDKVAQQPKQFHNEYFL